MMMRRRKKLKTAIYRRLCIILPSCSQLSSRAASRLVLIGLLLCLGTEIAAPFERAPKKSENPYALIFGTVWSPDNHPLYGVRVRIRRADDKNPRWELYSDRNGEFAQRIPAGKADYLVWADLKGYKYNSNKELRVGTEVTVHIEYDERADIGLHLR
jgi:hypothetical protein